MKRRMTFQDRAAQRLLLNDRGGQRRRLHTKDSTLAFFVNQLENLDRRLYEPLVSVSWGRDIKLRPGITMSNESTSFIRSAFGGAGTLSNGLSLGGNMPWISEETVDIPGISVNGQKITLPLRLLAREVTYTSVELDRSQLTGQPIDTQKMDALNLLYQMNTDQMCYVGSSDVGATGLLNNSSVSVLSVPAGASGSTVWTGKTPDEIVADINKLITDAWAAAAYAICPDSLLLPPKQFAYISSQKVSSAGNVSILKYIKDNCIALEVNGREIRIAPVKWLPGIGTNGEDRMVAYTNDESRVRFPMVPIRRETAYYRGIRFAAPYLWAFGELEIVYPETIYYGDGI
jgi:hypothetical protein